MPPESTPAASIRLGCDIGGTFTDIVLQLGDGRLFVNKVSTTPRDPGKAVLDGIRTVLAQAGVPAAAISEIVHGTTIASNAILQKAGAKTGVLTTRGFRDVLEIGRIRTPRMFDLAWRKPEPLAPRRWRLEVSERMAADGKAVRALDPEEVRACARFFAAEGVEALAVCFLNSYINPQHELQAKALLEREFPKLPVTLSCEVLPEMKEYERTSTTVVNAYILPVMRTYLARLRRDLREIGIDAPLQVMASNGGMMGVAAASERPVFAVASGPAGGVTGAARLGSVTGDRDMIVFDMGGTTAKASLVESGVPLLANEYEFREGMSSPSRFIKGGGYMLKVPAIDIAEVGAGGGSVASIDPGGLLVVGPESVGADPGPACYRLGNERPTVTDANMVLGYLNPAALAGGSLEVDAELARRAVSAHVAAPLGLTLIEAAHGIREVANVNMARAIRAVTVERGRDPREMTLVAFGGSGPVHAVDVARLLGIQRVVAPVMAGVFSALGMLAADAEHDFLRAVLRPIERCSEQEVATILEALQRQGREALAAEGYRGAGASFVAKADLRYVGQSSELTIGFSSLARARTDFQEAYTATFGYSNEEPVELVNLRLTARGSGANRLRFEHIRADPSALEGLAAMRKVSFERSAPLVDTPVIARRDMTSDTRRGPLIVESYDTTVVVPPGVAARADTGGNIILDLEGS